MTEPLAKPSGVLLKDHIRNLLNEAGRILATRPFVMAKYHNLTGEDFAMLLKQSARWHDEGKKHPDWQIPCQKDHEESQRSGKDCGENLRRANIRHEMASLDYMSDSNANVSLPVKIAVAAHHAKLSHRHKDRWHQSEYPQFEKFWKEFAYESSTLRISEQEDFEKAISKRYYTDGPRSWLQLIDHRASAFEQNEALPPLVAFSYKFPHDEKRGVQRIIEDLWDEPFAILRAPTGAGKTDAALLWAQHQIEAKRADHLVIAMPTRFTANALAISTAENLSATGLYHSSAWYQRLKDKEHPTFDEKKFIDKEQELARKLEVPCAVTTIDHLCICLTGTREDHHAIFFGLATACLVIDEADFYDEFTQQNIIVLLKALRKLEVPVLLMSATVPESSKDIYSASGFSISRIHEDNSDAERIRCVVKRHGKVKQPGDIADLLQRAIKDEPTIIYANTVARAQAYFEWFKRKEFEDVVLYHSRFTEPHKVEKEDKLIKMLGSEAWKSGKQHGVAILTQIGEISVNISADLMISDLCPIDRLAQRAGRLSRFDNRNGCIEGVVGELFIVEPYYVNKKTNELAFYPAPYGSYKNGWEMTEALSKSNELLFEGEYSARTFMELVNLLYPHVAEIKPHVRDNRRALEDCIITNWLILPAEQVEGDDDHTMNWRSRDVPPQYTIYADYESDVFMDSEEPAPRNKTELREWEIRHGINIYAYEFNKAVENGLLKTTRFMISEESIERLIVLPQYYSTESGLNFKDEVEDNF
jgi:CRISPR-associated endonuclease/helicase Cas3